MAENGNVLPGVIADAVFEIVDDGTTRTAKLKSSVDKVELLNAAAVDAGFVRWDGDYNTLNVGLKADDTTKPDNVLINATDLVHVAAETISFGTEKPLNINGATLGNGVLDASGIFAPSIPGVESGDCVFASYRYTSGKGAPTLPLVTYANTGGISITGDPDYEVSYVVFRNAS